MQSAQDPARSLDEVKEAACVAARAARIRGDSHAILKMCLKDLMTEGSSEMCFELGEYFLGQKDYVEAAMWYYNAVYETSAILDIRIPEMAEKRYNECRTYLEEDA